MRTLLILRGPKRSGKTRFVTDNDLSAWHVDQTSLERFHSSLTMTEEGTLRPDQHAQRTALEHLFFLLKKKFEASEFIICEMDDTGHPLPGHRCNKTDKIIRELSDIASTYRYETVVCDFHRPAGAPAAPLPYFEEDAAGYYQANPWPGPETRLTPAGLPDWIEKQKNPIIDLSHLDAIVAIGDVHAFHAPLSKCLSFAKGRENIAVVFTGDFINKGPHPAETLRLLDDFAARESNVFLLGGNHECGLEGWAWNRGPLRPGFTKMSLSALRKSGYRRHEARRFLSRLRDHYRFHWRGKDILVSHGGLSAPTDIPGLLPGNLMRMGVGPSDFDVDRHWERNNENPNHLQIHGHRNSHGLKPSDCLRSYNLEGIDSFNAIHGMVLKGNDRKIEVKGFAMPIKNPSS